MQGAFGATLAAGSETVQISATDTASIRAKRQRLDDVVATPNAAVTYYFQSISQCICNVGDAINRGRCGFKLSAAVIG